MAHLLKAVPQHREGRAETSLVEACTSRPGAVAADRFYFCRRHPMQAGAGGATRVYVHGHLKWRTVPTGAARPSARALSCRARVQSTPRSARCSAWQRCHPARSKRCAALRPDEWFATFETLGHVLDIVGHANLTPKPSRRPAAGKRRQGSRLECLARHRLISLLRNPSLQQCVCPGPASN
jgi:hypothetical protein